MGITTAKLTMNSTLEKPSKSEARLPKAVLYVGIPYAIRPDLMLFAKTELLKFFGTIAPHQDEYSFLPVNSLLTAYNSPDLPAGTVLTDKIIYSVAKHLIDASSGMLILRYPGWEYSEILMNEAAYAAATGKPVSYADPPN